MMLFLEGDRGNTGVDALAGGGEIVAQADHGQDSATGRDDPAGVVAPGPGVEDEEVVRHVFETADGEVRAVRGRIATGGEDDADCGAIGCRERRETVAGDVGEGAASDGRKEF